MANKKKTKKKAPAKPQQQMSPKNYILSGRARKLPIAECWITSNWKDAGMCSIIVARQHTNGNMTFGVYLVDTFCLGLKNTNSIFSKPRYEYEEICDNVFGGGQSKEPIDYVLAHNIIYGAIAYAEDLGFKPEKDWAVSQFILEEDTDDVELIEIEFGKNGKPCFVNGPYDNINSVLTKLNKNVGEGNYEFVMMADDSNDFYGFDDDDDDDFEEEDDFDDDDDDDVEDIDYEEVKS